MHGIHRQILTYPFFYRVSRVPHQRRVPREVPAIAIADHYMRKPRGCAPILISVGSMKEVVSFRDGEKGEADISSGHNWIWMDIRGQ